MKVYYRERDKEYKIPKAWYWFEYIRCKTSKGKKTSLLKKVIKNCNRQKRYANKNKQLILQKF